MNKIPKFHRKNPSTKAEKLIIELIDNLDKVTHKFVQKNNPGIITQETFIILRDASIGYAGAMTRDLMKMLQNKSRNNYIEFGEAAKQLFNEYIDHMIRECLSN